MEKIKKGLLLFFAICFFIVLYGGGLLIHIATCIDFFDFSERYGLLFSLMAFFTPGFSTLLLFIIYTIGFGFFNDFNLLLMSI